MSKSSSTSGFGEQPAADQHLLLVAAGERADLLHGSAARPIRSRSTIAVATAAVSRRGRIDAAARDARRRIGQREVVAHGHRQHQALGLAVLGHEAMPSPARIASAGRADAPRVARRREMLAAGRACRAPNSVMKSSALALPGEPADAEDLAARAGRTRRRRARVAAQVVAPRGRAASARDRGHVRVHAVDRPPGHQRDRLGLGDLFAGRDLVAVAEDGDPVGQVFDLAPAVRGEDDAAALVAQAAHVREEPLDLLLGECRGRLVEEEDPRLAQQGADDLDDLPVRDRQRRRRARRVDAVARRSACEDLVRLRRELAPADQAELAPRGRRRRQRFSATVIQGSSVSSWNTVPTPSGAVRSRGPRQVDRLAAMLDRSVVRLDDARTGS